ncbi:dihydrodipicolinate reductase, partial [mine drainage metagenome]
MITTDPSSRTGPSDPSADVDLRPRLIVAGATGRLGTALVAEAARLGFPIVGGIGRTPSTIASVRGDGTIPILPLSGLPTLLGQGQVYLSAMTPEAEIAALPQVAQAGLPAVVATTGIGDEGNHVVRCAARTIPIVVEANFSIGAQLLFRLLRALGPLPAEYDLSLTEVHRREKRDHPSATAVAVAEALAASGVERWEEAQGRRTPGTLEIASVRAGDSPGTHTVLIAGPHESLR